MNSLKDYAGSWSGEEQEYRDGCFGLLSGKWGPLICPLLVLRVTEQYRGSLKTVFGKSILIAVQVAKDIHALTANDSEEPLKVFLRWHDEQEQNVISERDFRKYAIEEVYLDGVFNYFVLSWDTKGSLDLSALMQFGRTKSPDNRRVMPKFSLAGEQAQSSLISVQMGSSVRRR